MQHSSSLIFCSFPVAFWQKSSRDQAETAPHRGTDQQNRTSNAEPEQHSTAGHVCLRGNLPNNCCFLKRSWIVDKQVDIVKRACQREVDIHPEGADWPTRCHCFFFLGGGGGGGVSQLTLHPKCHTEWTEVASLSMQLPKAASRMKSFEIHKTQFDVAEKSSAFFSYESAPAC